MRVVLISDTHNLHENLKLPEGDILIHSGDVSGNGTFREVLNFLQWFSELPFKNKIFIAGNHDFAFEKKMVPISDLPPGVTYLEDSAAVIDGLKIYGSPYTPEFLNWAFMKKRGPQIKKVWDKIPSDIDILVTHGPPLMVLDQTAEGRHQGCEDLLLKVRQVKPKVHVFGHIHEAYGMEEQYGVRFINASVLDRQYQMINAPFVVDL